MNFLGKGEKKDYEDASLFKDFVKVVNLPGTILHLGEAGSVEGRLHNMMRNQTGDHRTDGKCIPSVFDKRFKDNAIEGMRKDRRVESRFKETSILNNIFRDKCVVENKLGRDKAESRFRNTIFESKYSAGVQEYKDNPQSCPREVQDGGAEKKTGENDVRRVPGPARRSASTSCILGADELECFQARRTALGEDQAWSSPQYYSFDSHKFAHDEPVKQRYRFKSYDEATDRLARINKHTFKAPENGEGFTCAYCEAKYVYKRCLVNHLLKSHRKIIKQL